MQEAGEKIKLITNSFIDAGVKFAIANAIERHRRLRESICSLREGQVVTLTADEIPAMDVDKLTKK